MDDQTMQREGFLCVELSETITNIRARYRQWFELAEVINRLGMRWLYGDVASGVENKQRFVTVVLLMRVMQSYQSALILAERGIITDAHSLVRSLAETAIAIGAAHQDVAVLGEQLKGDYHRHRRTIVHLLLTDREALQLSPEDQQALEEAVTEVKSLR